MSLRLPDLMHELGNQLNVISVIAGCLADKIKDSSELSAASKEEFIKSLKNIEAKVQAASGEINNIKGELNSRSQYT